MPLGLDQKVATIVWSPLGWGRLTGKVRRGKALPEVSRLHSTAEQGPPVPNESLYKVVDTLDEVSRETGKTIPQIALNWLLQRPTVANVIIGARNEEQLRQNLAAVGWNLTAEQIARLDAASEVTPPYPYWHQRQFSRNPRPVWISSLRTCRVTVEKLTHSNARKLRCAHCSSEAILATYEVSQIRGLTMPFVPFVH